MAEYFFSNNEDTNTNVLSDTSSSYGFICSPMNYIGGKYKLLPQLIPLFPTNINTFVDLFCGGCNVGINAHANRYIFNDNLTYLIELYRTFCKLSFNEIITHVENRINKYELSLTNDIGYKQIRELYNIERNPLDLFVLVAYSFNHQIRFNNSHEFNNPFGKERSCFNPKMSRNLYNFVNSLHSKNVEFTCENFEDFNLLELTSNDFIYCDPPYLITTGTYNDGKRGFTGWNEFQEKKLLTLLENLNHKGIKFALSNVLVHKGKVNHLLIEWLNKNNFNVTHINKDYSNSNYHTINRDKQASDEVLITNYTPIHDKLLF